MELTLEDIKQLIDEDGNLDLSNRKDIISLPENMPAIGGWLDLRGCTGLTSLPENMPAIGGSLYLSGCTGLTSLPENMPAIGGWLDLRGCTGLTSLPENMPAIGGSLDLRGCTGLTKKEKEKKCKELKEGYCEDGKYIFCDGILTHVRKIKKFGKYTFYEGLFDKNNVIFDGENYAHCKSFREGVSDLNYKKLKDRGQEQYSDLTPESILPAEDMIDAYRIITGACKAGTEQFLSSLSEIKKEYSVKEVIEITKGHYNATVFEDFFKKNQ